MAQNKVEYNRGGVPSVPCTRKSPVDFDRTWVPATWAHLRVGIPMAITPWSRWQVRSWTSGWDMERNNRFSSGAKPYLKHDEAWWSERNKPLQYILFDFLALVVEPRLFFPWSSGWSPTKCQARWLPIGFMAWRSTSISLRSSWPRTTAMSDLDVNSAGSKVLSGETSFTKSNDRDDSFIFRTKDKL